MGDSVLFDQFGVAIRASALYKTPVSKPGNFKRITPPRPKTFEAVLAWQRREQVDISRIIAAGVPTVDDALVQAGEFSVGDSWHIKYRGANKAWGKRRDEWFNQTYAFNCNTRGPQNDWWSSLRQLNWTRKVHGDYGILFDGKPLKDSTGKETPASGKFHVVTYDRIGTGLNVAASVGGGLEQVKELGNNYLTSTYPTLMVGFYGMYVINDSNSIFDGQRIIDGVIVDANMGILGYRVNGFSDSGRAIYIDIPKEQIHVNFSARKMPDMVRGMPEMAEQILPVLHLDDIQDLISMAMKLSCGMAITRESIDGNPNRNRRFIEDEDDWNPPETAGSAGDSCPPGVVPFSRENRRALEEIYPGIYELATNNQESLKTLQFDRPSMNEEAFIERIETAILHKLWPRALLYPGGGVRAAARTIAIQARTIARWDQLCLERSARWIADRATEFSMRAGYIPGNDKLADAYSYGFTVPAEFTVDEGNDAKMRLNALGRCTISRGKITELDGYLAEEIEEERFAEEQRLAIKAEAMNKQFPWMTQKEWLLRFDSGEAQQSFSDNAAQPEKKEPEKETEADPSPKGEPGAHPAGRIAQWPRFSQ